MLDCRPKRADHLQSHFVDFKAVAASSRPPCACDGPLSRRKDERQGQRENIAVGGAETPSGRSVLRGSLAT